MRWAFGSENLHMEPSKSCFVKVHIQTFSKHPGTLESDKYSWSYSPSKLRLRPQKCPFAYFGVLLRAPNCVLGNALSSTISTSRLCMASYWFLQAGCAHSGKAPNHSKIGTNLKQYNQNKKQLPLLWSMCIFAIFWGKQERCGSFQNNTLRLVCSEHTRIPVSTKRPRCAGRKPTSKARHGFLGTSGCAPEGKYIKLCIRCISPVAKNFEDAKNHLCCSETVLNTCTKSRSVSEIAPTRWGNDTMLLHKQLQVSLTDPYDELNTNRNSQMVFRATLGALKGAWSISRSFVLNPPSAQTKLFSKKLCKPTESLQSIR